MVKRFEKKKCYVQPLDLHGVRHGDVPTLVENYILQYQYECPLKIIIGNSDKMKNITNYLNFFYIVI